MPISTHAPAGGATPACSAISTFAPSRFLLTPLREGRRSSSPARQAQIYFYSRPCGRGDAISAPASGPVYGISTHAPAGGATETSKAKTLINPFLLTPLREGRLSAGDLDAIQKLFLLTPLREGRQARAKLPPELGRLFLLTPLREGRHRAHHRLRSRRRSISTHAPAGGATRSGLQTAHTRCHFYSRPCGRGDSNAGAWQSNGMYFYSRPCGRGDQFPEREKFCPHCISTHAPAGGATAIFHKSVMRFCGKLPKDDTVLCLASFGFPRRDPKAVYLAWISCANLPQKCVRQGLALKDQGTSCFHEGLASHAFDPVLV